MAKKDDRSNIVELLTQPHFGDPDAQTPDAGEPVMETMLVLTLDELGEYDRNPRRARNEEYDTLKASYLESGASQTLLVVTKRPGEQQYFCAAGGNTRLRVLRELWQATGDEKFYRVNCKFVPYQGETRILVDHLKENDNRADYILIDRARAVCGLFERLDSEQDGSLSQRAFIDRLEKLGYPKLSQSQLRRFQAAVDLYRHIPLALDGGMHIRAVIRLQDTHDDLKSFLDKATGGLSGVSRRLDDHWDLILQELDNPEGIDLDELPGRVFSALASAAAERVPDLSNEEITLRLGRLWKKWRADRSQNVSLRQGTVSRRDDPSSTRPGPSRHYFVGGPENHDWARDQSGGEGTGTGVAGDGPARADPPATAPSAEREALFTPGGSRRPVPEMHGIPPRSPSVPGQPDDIETQASLQRTRHIERYRVLADEAGFHARTFGAGWGLDGLISSLDAPDMPGGFGFYIDLPEGRLQGKEATAWWLLWDFSSITQNLRAFQNMLDQGYLAPTSQIAGAYRDVAEGKASIKKLKIDALPEGQRGRALLTAFVHLVETWVPRSQDQVGFLLHIPDEPCESFMRLVRTGRKILAHLDSQSS